ncbi:MAG TPA: hypothetical protein DEQ80_05005 [Anaerolinea thermolimosa]|uniref:Uncharacterized protein n=1 Tax=Anaerolinea thermolimosa TaxID=229919 RepID=A0A3D1JHF4_9CHLR|nr:hypothetical protein [Anaerolinea thermolimosa]
MLRGVFIGQHNGFIQVSGNYGAAAVGQRLGNNFGARPLFQLAGNRQSGLFGQRCRGGQKDCRSEHVMFGLGQQVGCNPFRVGSFVGDHQGLSGAGQAIDAHHSINLFLRQSHKKIAGAKNFIHPGNTFGAERQSGNGLRATQGINLLDPHQSTGGQDDGGYLAGSTLRRSNHDDLLYSGYLCWHDGH